MRILHARNFAVQPWKNGGGTTTEIMAWPTGAGLDAFEWRVSMASVAEAGPFSSFPGVDRSLGLLAGEGIDLDIDGRGTVELRPGAHPAVFPGDVPVGARLVGGAILDLNVMSRRGRWRHHLSRATAAGAFELRRRGDVTMLLARGAGGSAAGSRFGDGDAVLLDAIDDRQVVLALDGTAELWIVDLWKLQP